MYAKIQKLENRQGLRFPKHVLQEAHIKVGDELNVFVSNGPKNK